MLFVVLFIQKGKYNLNQEEVAGPGLLCIQGNIKLCWGEKTLLISTKSNMQKFSSLYKLFMSKPHLHSKDEGLCCSHSLWCVLHWVEHRPSEQLQDIWALPVHEVRWGNPPTHLILPVSIYQLAAAYKAVNSSLLPTWCSFVGSPFHGAAPIFNISYFSFGVQLFGKGALFLNHMYE